MLAQPSTFRPSSLPLVQTVKYNLEKLGVLPVTTSLPFCRQLDGCLSCAKGKYISLLLFLISNCAYYCFLCSSQLLHAHHRDLNWLVCSPNTSIKLSLNSL